jgi:hypothetical protein
MHLSAPPPGQEWEHDLLLDPIRKLHPFDSLMVGYRTSDGSAAFVVSVEVNDIGKKRYFCALHASASSRRTNVPRMGPAPIFRNAASRSEVVTELPSIIPDGRWHTLRVRGEAVTTESDTCTFRRFDFVRFRGALDISSVTLARSQAFSG